MGTFIFYVVMTLFVLVGGSFLQSQLVALYILIARVSPEEGVALFRRVDKELNTEFYKQYFEGINDPTNYLKHKLFLRLGISMLLPLASVLFGFITIISGLTDEQSAIEYIIGIVCLIISIVYMLATLGILVSVRQIHKGS